MEERRRVVDEIRAESIPRMLPTASERKSDASTTPWAPVQPGGTTSAIERRASDVELGIAQPGVETVRPRASRSGQSLSAWDATTSGVAYEDHATTSGRAAECASGIADRAYSHGGDTERERG